MASTNSLLLPLLLVLILGATVSADVVTLTDNTFADKVKEKDTVWFIKFFAPWCGHCKKLAPTWEELGKSLDGENGLEIGLVDCTTQKKTCGDADIRSYPQLRIFYDGKDMKKYAGPRDLESLKAYALNAAAELSKVDDGEAAAGIERLLEIRFVSLFVYDALLSFASNDSVSHGVSALSDP